MTRRHQKWSVQVDQYPGAKKVIYRVEPEPDVEYIDDTPARPQP